MALRDLEMPSQIEQGALSHLVADAFGAYEAEGEVLAVAAGTGAPMNMGPHGSGVRCLAQDINIFLWHYIGFSDDIKQLREKIGEIATIPYLIKAHGG